MMRSGMFLMVMVAAAVPAQAQSLFATRGLGLPLPPLDARARALGGNGVGLFGLSTSLVNPAEIAGIPRRGVTAALQPVTGSTSIADAEDDISGTRFPLVRLMFPVGTRSVFSLGYGGQLEQSWAIVNEGFEMVGADSIPTRDLIQSSGGIAQAIAGFAYSVTPGFALGVSVGVHTGNLDRRVTRTFSDTASELRPFTTRTRWDYTGPIAAVGFRWDPLSVLRLGGSFTYMGDLEVDAVEGLARDDRAALPYRFAAGASSWLSPQLLLVAGADYTWGNAGDVFENAPGGAQRRNTWRWGGGIEYEGTRNARRVFPFRLGGSYAQLPYFDLGESSASEWAASVGSGYKLVADDGSPVAALDATLERGRRSGLESTQNPDGLSESFWRLTFSLSLFGR